MIRQVTRLGLAVTACLAIMGGTADAQSDWEISVTKAADYLLQYQNDDGGFPWKLTEAQRLAFDGTSQSPANTLGATARGFVAAYQATGQTRFLDAANDVADLIEDRYDNSINIGSYGPPFYNKDVEFAHELAAAGGNDIVTKANASAIAYFNDKKADYPAAANAAEAVRQRYVDSGWATPGAQMWMLGNWVHVGALLGTEEIEAGYTGNDFATDLHALIEADYGTYFDPSSDVYGTLGLFGILEASYFATGTAGGTDALDQITVRLDDPGSYFGFQDLGYTTYVLGLLDDPNAVRGSYILMDWMNADGGWVYSSGNWYGEGHGEALLGLAGNPVPVPAAALAGMGLLSLLGLRRRR